MKKNLTKIFALVLALVMVLTLFAACKKNDGNTDEPTDDSTDPVEVPSWTMSEEEQSMDYFKEYEYGTDYVDLYGAIGDKVTADMVEERDGLAYVTVDDTEYELGMDFLSMAMVYKCDPIEGSEEFSTADDVYNFWWKLYIQRWNYLAVEVPLYSNQYYHVYNSKIQDYSVSPYWGAANALPVASVDTSKGENSVILGNTTELNDSFRYAAFGVSSPNAAQNDITKMTQGLETVTTNEEGAMVWNDTVVKSHEEVTNEDGSKTTTIEIYDDLVYSDGTPITAKDYLSFVLAFNTPVMDAVSNYTYVGGQNYVGWADFKAATEPTPFTGLRLINDYTFSVTLDPSQLPYYYETSWLSFGPTPLNEWLGDADIKDDGEGAYITESFYAKDGDDWAMEDHILAARTDISTYPYSGAYTIESWDASTSTAVLKLNPNYKGDFAGRKPSIETISYIRIVAETQNEWLTTGKVDILADITGGDETKAALKIAEDEPEKYSSTYYNRAGYGKLGFRGDFGPAMFAEVRRAVMYSIDRNAFAQDFTGGYGAVVHGPYYEGSAPYLANKDTILLDQYATSEASAIAQLEKGGWIYNSKGELYQEGDGIRYRELGRKYQTPENLAYASIDGNYKTVEIDGKYYMPLVINWFCTADNNVSEMLKTYWQTSEITKNIGMEVQYTQGEFNPMLAELYQSTADGWNGTAVYSAFNFATGFNSAIYDYAYNWSVNPDYYDYSQFYIWDEADVYWLNK